MASSPAGKLKNQKEERCIDRNPYVDISFGRLTSQLHPIWRFLFAFQAKRQTRLKPS